MNNVASAQQTYAALSWAMVTFLGVLGLCWLIRPRGYQVRLGAYWLFASKLALIGGSIVGVLCLVLGAGFIWEWGAKP